MGATFKENVSDIRNSKVADVYNELKSYMVKVHVADPFADSDEVRHEYGYTIQKRLDKDYDAVILAVNHEAYMAYDEEYFQKLTGKNALFFDVKGVFRNKITKMTYKSL